VDKTMNDLHLKPSYAMDSSKWREMIRGNCTDSDSVAVTRISGAGYRRICEVFSALLVS